MIFKVFSLYDNKVQKFRSPFVQFDEKEAQADYVRAVESGKIERGFARDNDLYCIGTFDDSTGSIVSESTLVVKGISFTPDGGLKNE